MVTAALFKTFPYVDRGCVTIFLNGKIKMTATFF